MRKGLIVLACIVFFACAKLSVETREPIKVDINMRVDIYQHVVEDVQSINDQIYGVEGKQLNRMSLIPEAYAQDALSAAIQSRRARIKQVEGYFVMGYIGENRNALLEIRAKIPESEQAAVKTNIQQENADRETIYQATAQKNNTSVDEVRKVFYEDDYKRALSGFLFEVLQGGRYVWMEKP